MPKRKSKNAKSVVVTKIATNNVVVPEKLMRTAADEDRLLELKTSIADVGLINPISVYRSGEDFVLIAGWRRLIAVRALGWKEVDARVYTRREAVPASITLHENLAREDVNIVDCALYLDAFISDEKITQEQAARRLQKSLSWVRERMQVLEYPSCVREALQRDEISQTIARELVRCGDELQVRTWLTYGVRNGITTALARAWVQQWKIAQQQPSAVVSDREIGADPADIGIPKLICEICGDELDIEKIKMVRVHQDCFISARHVVLQMISTPTPEPT